jgi:hypothetical protein
MDSETLSTLNNNIKNHLPVQSNGLISAPDPPQQPFVIGMYTFLLHRIYTIMHSTTCYNSVVFLFIDFQFPDAENASVQVLLEVLHPGKQLCVI